MNRPAGFDLADLTATEARALRNTAYRVNVTPRAFELRQAKRRRSAEIRQALATAARLAGGAAVCVGIVAWFAVWLGV